MDLQTLLERVEPTRLKQLGSLLALGESLTKSELVDWVSQELPFCQVEEDGNCVGIDGAFYIAVDLVNDMMTLELLRNGQWVRNQGDGKVIEYKVTDAVSELSVGDDRLLLALLAVATYNDGELPLPKALTAERFKPCLVIETRDEDSPTSQLAIRPSQLPPNRRASIPPGISATFDSMRPVRNSVIPSAPNSDSDSPGLSPALIEWVLTLPRHTIVSAAFALTARGADSHVIAVGPTGGRAVISADAVEAAEKLFEDHHDSLPPPSQNDAMVAYRKRLTNSLSFFGISASDGSALVQLATELGSFPDFWSRSNPPPRALARRELKDAPEELAAETAALLYNVFYASEFESAEALLMAWAPRQRQ